MIDLVTITDQKVLTTSLIVANSFEKQHKHVLRNIANIECSDEFRRRNFAPSSYLNDQNKPQPMYQITRDGFTFLAMGFTGKKAAEFKEKFIAAFNTMEQALLEGQADRKQIDINHSRGITNPHGLDIKYTLDLTKIVQQPNATGLKIMERLTGLQFSDIAEEVSTNALDSGGVSTNVVTFSREYLVEDQGAWVEIEAIHNSYSDFCAAQDTRALAVGTFCRELRKIYPQLIRKRSSQGRRLWGYENIRLLPPA